MGVEPTLSAWKADVLAIILMVHKVYLAFQMCFRSIVPRRGLVRIELRYFDSLPITHSLIHIKGFRFHHM